VAIFRRLGAGVVKRRKAIVVAWVLILIGGVPLSTQLGAVTSSGSGGFGESSAESTRAQEILDEQFPRAFDNSSAILVVTDDDVTGEGTRDFVLGVEDRVAGAAPQQHLSSFTSAYSVARDLAAEAALQAAPLMAGVNFTAFVVWGIPSTFVAQWLATNASLNVSARDEAAHNATVGALGSLGLDNASLAGALGYEAAFYGAWAQSASNLTLVSDAVARAQASVAVAAPLYAGQVPDPQQAGLVLGVAQGFDMDTWSLSAAHAGFVAAQFAAFGFGSPDPAFIEAAGSLGPSPSRPQAEALADGAVRNGTLSSLPVPLPADIRRAFVAPANDTMLVIVGYDLAPVGFGSVEGDPVLKNVLELRALVRELMNATDPPGEVLVTGNAATSLDSAVSGEEDFERIEPATIGAVIILVSLFFMAAFVVFVPLGSIMMAFVVTQAVVFLIGSFIVKVPADTLTFLFTILIGVGIDYAVFLMARYREERAEGAGRHDAVATSVTWAGESITTSGVAVVVSFAVLATGSFEMLRAMGLAVGVGVGVALLVSLTLIPALLALLGNRVFWPTSGDRFRARQQKVRERDAARGGNYFRRAAQFSVDHAKLVVLLAVLASLPTTYISITGQTSYDFIAGLPDTESNRGLHEMQEAFGAGQLGPTQVVVQFPDPVWDNASGLDPAAAAELEDMSLEILGFDNVQQVQGPTRPRGTPISATNLSRLSPAEVIGVDGFVGLDNRTVLLSVILVQEPFTPTSMDTIRALRVALHERAATDLDLAGAGVFVGGQTALTIDFASDMDDQFLSMRLLVTIAVYLVLLFVLGSYLLPAAAVASVAASITWAYALTLFFFNDVFSLEVLFLIPLILFVLLMGIGMDYNIFILTRIREESEKGKSPPVAAVDAVERTGGIITALALVLASALGSLMLSSNSMLQGFGFAIATAVLLDAMIVRTYLVPAVMALLGTRAWWGPKRLQRVDPKSFKENAKADDSTAASPAKGD
jgi:RND superfamily putative drug exporter